MEDSAWTFSVGRNSGVKLIFTSLFLKIEMLEGGEGVVFVSLINCCRWVVNISSNWLAIQHLFLDKFVNG